jgi:prophage DNA circulation protein
MENNRAHEIMVEVLQKALAGKLCANINLHGIADAIAVKVDFEKTYTTSKSDQITGKVIDAILARQDEMSKEMEKVDKDQPVLKNFINGKLTAYTEVLSDINHL